MKGSLQTLNSHPRIQVVCSKQDKVVLEVFIIVLVQHACFIKNDTWKNGHTKSTSLFSNGCKRHDQGTLTGTVSDLQIQQLGINTSNDRLASVFYGLRFRCTPCDSHPQVTQQIDTLKATTRINAL